MFGRSKVFLRGKAPNQRQCVWLQCCLLMAGLMFPSCQHTPEQEVAEALQHSYDCLSQGDAEGYVQMLDFGSRNDSLFQTAILAAARNHARWVQQQGQIRYIKMQKVCFCNDTLAQVFYTLYLTKGDSLFKEQQMVKSDGLWKLRMTD